MTRAREVSELCGELLVAGMPGTALDEETSRALSERRRSGVILFRRNVESVEGVFDLCRSLIGATASEHGPFICVDQEGGRVVRIPPPAIQLPPMRTLGLLGKPGLCRRAGAIVGAELLAMGINVTFAPVLDVDTNPNNPVIGDRSFGSDPVLVGEMGNAFADGLQARGVLACGKHYPGHGDTHLDSHLELPVVSRPREHLEATELVPFRRTVGLVGSLMTAHVVYDALDPGVPATLSHQISTDFLRRVLGFRGLLFSDDLEMKAIADRHGVENAAVLAIRAGCDVLLVCSKPELADRAHEALVHAAEADEAFRERCIQAAERSRSARRRF
ncbi:MAG TPA: beta-N-acetylhexosaminidase, partial [Polyangiaceae bacterium]|nr:beta-N-acetylhexosaminidase [Polyangiaceae bacterium]